MNFDIGIEGLDDVQPIGRGGSALVYSARQVAFDRWVAVKVITNVWDEATLRRFRREQQAMGRLSTHAGIVPVYTAGTTTSGNPYLVMPYYRNGSLHDRLTSEPLPVDEAVKLVAQVARTLAVVHEQKVLHRDLKPGNILIDDHGQPLIADFGIARTGYDSTGSLSTSLTLTPAYSPPEAFYTATPTVQTDIYGLGSTLWAAIAGRPPFVTPGADDGPFVLMNRIMNDPVPLPHPDLPPAVMAVLSRAMAKNGVDRYAAASEFADALEATFEIDLREVDPATTIVDDVVVVDDATLVPQSAEFAPTVREGELTENFYATPVPVEAPPTPPAAPPLAPAPPAPSLDAAPPPRSLPIDRAAVREPVVPRAPAAPPVDPPVSAAAPTGSDDPPAPAPPRRGSIRPTPSRARSAVAVAPRSRARQVGGPALLVLAAIGAAAAVFFALGGLNNGESGPVDPPAAVQLAKGDPGPEAVDCLSEACRYITVNLEPNGTHTVWCSTGSSGDFYSYATNLATSSVCYCDCPGEQVWVTVDGVKSNVIDW